MSKSNPKLTNPASKFIEFAGDQGEFHYYDRDLEKKVPVPMPIYFVVLDELSTISGFNDKHQSKIYSNEVKFIGKDILNVRSFKGGISIKGIYGDIKGSIIIEGGKYTKSIYAMWIKGKNDYELVNFQLKGASLAGTGENSRAGWMNKSFDIEKYGVCVKETDHGTKGKTKYQSPVFNKFNLTPDVNLASIEMDKKLQVYLNTYLNQKIEKEASDNTPLDELEPLPQEDFSPDPTYDDFDPNAPGDKLPWE